MQAVSLAQELEARFSFALFAADQSLSVAEASGLKFTDKNIKKGEKYVYKIYSLVPSKTYSIDTGYVFIGTNERNPLPKPLELKADFGDRVVMLSWNKVYYEHIYTTYFIERSSDGGKTFKRTNALPVVNSSPTPENKAEKMYKVDSLPVNNLNYVFRVRGITLFEEVGPPSDTVQGTGKDPSLQFSPRIVSVENQKDASIIIKWKFPEDYNDKIKEFEILRSVKANGEYKSISKVKSIAREYKDLKPERVNYYIIKVIDVSGLYSNSFPALGQPVDSISPSSPEGLTGKIDKAGKLTLQWRKGKDPDISGYRVYMANAKKKRLPKLPEIR
ncbi:MAG: fibronectin type III domain-containing protein [Cytophagaceae bacterium]|nr:fibronectin type III domain-containing protein [Cytophagaceae bacterium]